MPVDMAFWRVRFDLWLTRGLLWVARAIRGGEGEPKPDVHLYLSNLYGWLTNYYSRRGKVAKALHFEQKAARHNRAAGPHSPPRAAAVAMPIPRPPLFTDARAEDPRDPDDAA